MDANLNDYQAMFALTNADFGKTILDCDTGLARYSADVMARGGQVLVCEPFSQKASLGFPANQFQLALCLQQFFLPESSGERYLAKLLELCRVAGQVRIFLATQDQKNVSQLLGPLMMELQSRNYGVEIRQVSYGVGSVMLRVWSQECAVKNA